MQGLIVTKSGQIFEHEHGPRGGDEMNLIEPSLNYGWPAITYGIDYSGAVISPFTEKKVWNNHCFTGHLQLLHPI